MVTRTPEAISPHMVGEVDKLHAVDGTHQSADGWGTFADRSLGRSFRQRVCEYALGGTPCQRLNAWQNVEVSV